VFHLSAVEKVTQRQIYFVLGNHDYYGGEIVGSVKGGTNHYLKFNTYSNGTVTERVRITGNEGYVGINTATPAYILDVNGTLRVNAGNTVNNKLLVLYDANSGESLTSGTSFYGFGINSSILRYQVPSGNIHSFYNGTSEYMRIANGGNVGIGTNNPLAPLHINATAAGGIFRITGISVTGYMFVNSTGSLGFNNNTSNTWSISYGGDINSNSLTTSSLYLNTTNPSNTGQLGYIFTTSTTTAWSTTTVVVAQLSMGYSGTYIINFAFNCQCPSFPSTITVNFYNNPSSSTSLYTYSTNFIATSLQQYGCCSFPFNESYIEARIFTSGNNAYCNAKLQATRVG
jgi:hypothetical protein